MILPQKWISILLAFALMLSVFPVYAHAEEFTDTGPDTDTVNVTVSIEPEVALSAPRNVYLTDTAEAAKLLRKGMKERQSPITVYFQASADTEYSQIVDAIWKETLAHTGVPTEGDYLYRQYGYMECPASYYPINGKAYYTIHFNVTYYTTAEQEAKMDKAVAALLDELDLDGKSDYEKLCAVYEWMCANISYDYDNLNDNTYDLKYTGYAALIDRTSVCQGYAVLLYRLMLELGIDCRIISGIGNGGPHAWNIVKLDGKYYNVDATFDATYYQVLGKYNYFLRCDETFESHSRDSEFATKAFYAAYPMGETDYDPNAASQKVSGDINGDGSLNNKDVTRLFQYLSGWDAEVNEKTLDVNGDGSVNNKDVTRLFQYLSGWDVEIY